LLSFTALGVPARLADVLTAQGIVEPTPIQAATLPDSLAGRDVLGRGRTGSGKTIAFLLPLVARLQTSSSRRAPKRPRALILAPTRELVTQIDAALAPLAATCGLRSRTVFGGVGQHPQVQALRAGVDILVACPGRLEDLVGQRACDLGAIEITVLDEADHMADLGFLPGVRRLMDATPSRAQRMLFSATLDAGVDVLVERYLHDAAVHEADSAQSPIAEMEHHVLHIEREARVPVLVELTSAPGRALVFTRTKHGARALTRQLNARGVRAVELHGNLAQPARTRNMEAFHAGRATTLVATDIAARGIHVDDVTLVVHADPPAEHKAYLHRSGRTARAGASGTVVTLMTDQQVADVRALTRAAKISPTITRVNGPGHPLLRELAPGERTRRPEALVEERTSAPTGSGRRSWPDDDRASRGSAAGRGDRRRGRDDDPRNSGGRFRPNRPGTPSAGRSDRPTSRTDQPGGRRPRRRGGRGQIGPGGGQRPAASSARGRSR